MKPRSTWILLTIAGLLCAFIFLVEQPARKARLQKTSRKIFPQLNPAAIKSVQISPAGQPEIRAERTNGIWQLTKPLAYPAEAGRVEALLQALAQVEWQTRISAQELENRPQALEEFHLAPPQFSLEINDGNYSHHLLVGETNALGDQVSLQVVGGENIYLANAELLKFIPRARDDWRDGALVNLETLPFDVLKVRSGGKELKLLRDPTNHFWRMISPLEVRADNSKINELLKTLQLLRVSAFLENAPADLEPYGFASTQTPELELSFENTNVLLDLQIGASPTNLPGYVFARRKNPSNIVLVAKEPFKEWQTAYANFLDRHLLSLPPSAIDAIEVRGEDQFTLLRTSNNWQVVGEKEFPADPDFARNLLASFTNIEAEIEQTVVADFASYGLKPPLLQFTLKSSNRTVAQIEFGTNKTDKIFEHCAGEQPVNVIPREQFDRLPRASWQMRDRHIWNFESNNVVGITIHQKGSAQKMIRDLNNEWTFAPGYHGIINQASLEETLHRLGELKAVFWSGRGEENLERFGFKEVDHRITLDVKRGKQAQQLIVEFGKPSPYLHPYATVLLDGERLIFEFPIDLYSGQVRHDLTIPPAFRTRPE